MTPPDASPPARRAAMKPVFAALAALLVSGPVAAAETRPHVVFVMADDMGWGRPATAATRP